MDVSVATACFSWHGRRHVTLRLMYFITCYCKTSVKLSQLSLSFVLFYVDILYIHIRMNKWNIWKEKASWPAFKPMFWNHDIRFFNHQVGFNYCNMIFVRVVYNIFWLRIDKMHLWHVQMVQNITLGEHLRKWRPFSNMAASMRNDSVLPKSSMTGHKSFHL